MATMPTLLPFRNSVNSLNMLESLGPVYVQLFDPISGSPVDRVFVSQYRSSVVWLAPWIPGFAVPDPSKRSSRATICRWQSAGWPCSMLR